MSRYAFIITGEVRQSGDVIEKNNGRPRNDNTSFDRYVYLNRSAFAGINVNISPDLIHTFLHVF